jgi:myo-inositol 2-dehydrogenase / D-chiro-inositol 1-dehydrogenase
MAAGRPGNSPVRPLRFGLIGCGEQGRQLVIALGEVPGTQLVACCDPNSAALNAMPADRVARFADYQTMLQEAELDAVIVATLHSALASATLASVECGHHVFCEKPLATTAPDARLVVQAARQIGVNLMVGYIQRFDPLRQRMKEFLDRDAFGELAYVVAGKGGPPLERTWQHSRAHGGGQLLWVGSHLMDQLHWLLGRRVERVYAEIRRSTDTGIDLTTVATLRFEGGVIAHFDCSSAANDVYDYVEPVGTDGRGRAEWRPNYGLRVQSRRVPDYASPPELAQSPPLLDRACVAELTEFVNSIREARQPCVTGDDAVQVLEVLDAITLSAEFGQPVTLR